MGSNFSTSNPKVTQPNKRVGGIAFLGTGHSGKSAIFKQFWRHLAPEDFSKNCHFDFVYKIPKFTLQTFVELYKACSSEFEIPLFKDIEPEHLTFPQMKLVLELPQVQKVWSERAERKICYGYEHLPYFINKLASLNGQYYYYDVSDEDGIKFSYRTTGLNQMEYPFKGEKIKILDTGGQISERRKWETLDPDLIVFVISAANYHHGIYERHDMKYFVDAKSCFKTVVESVSSEKKIFVLFTQMDILEANVDCYSGLEINIKSGFSDLTKQEKIEMWKEQLVTEIEEIYGPSLEYYFVSSMDDSTLAEPFARILNEAVPNRKAQSV